MILVNAPMTEPKAAFGTGKDLGKHVITSNKGPPALAYNELKAIGDKNNAKFMIEATVMAGTPAVNTGKKSIAGNKVHGFKGIINGPGVGWFNV